MYNLYLVYFKGGRLQVPFGISIQYKKWKRETGSRVIRLSVSLLFLTIIVAKQEQQISFVIRLPLNSTEPTHK